MPVRFGYDEELPNNWTNTGDTYNGPGIASNMQSYGMNGSPYSALVPQGQANPFAGTLAMNPGATDTNNFSGWESQFTQPSQPQSPVIGSPALTGGGQRPASASGTGGYDPNWQPLLTPYNTSNPGAAGDPDAWVRNLDQETYYKYILPYQQRGGNIRDVAAMQKVIQDGMSAAGGGQWANGSQVNNVAGQRLDNINNPNAYGNQNRGGVAAQPQPTQNGSVSNTPQFNWPGLPQVDPATNYGGGVMDAAAVGGSKPFNLNDFLINQYNGNNAPGGGMMGRDSQGYAGQLSQGQMRFLASGGSPSDMAGMSNARYQQPAMNYAPGSMEERYAALYGGGPGGATGGNQPGQYGNIRGSSEYQGNPWQAAGMADIMARGGSGYEQPAFGPPRQGKTGNYSDYSGGYATGGMDQPWNQGGGGRAATNPNWNGMNDYAIPGGYQFGGSQSGDQNSLAALYQQFMGGNGGQVSGYGRGVQDYTNGVSYDGGQSWMGGVAAQNAAPGSMQQRNQAFYQNPGSVFGSPATGGGTSNSSGSGGGSSATPVMASPSFGFGAATNRRAGYGNQSSYYGGGSNPNAFGGSSYGTYNTGRPSPPDYSSPGYANTFNSMGTSNNSSGGFAAGRTGRPAGFTF